MANYLNPFSGRQFIDASGTPYSGAKLFIYQAGTSTKITTYKDSAGASSHTNPIVLNSKGEPADGAGASQPIWQSSLYAVKLVLAPANDTDPPASSISTWDNISGINNIGDLIDQRSDTGAVAFTLHEYHENRAINLMTDFIPSNLHAGIEDGTNATDLSAYVQAAADAALANDWTLEAEGGTYLLNDTVDLRFIRLKMDNAIFSINHADVGIRLGGNASSGNNPRQDFGSATRVGGVTATPTIRATGVKGQVISVEYTDYFQVYADTAAAERDNSYSCGYSSFYLKYCVKLELQSNPDNAGGAANSDVGGTVQWINENQFYLNRTTTLILDGTYQHNHNKFYAGTFEVASTININYGRDNRIYGARFETGSTTITFGTNSSRNVIVNTYDDSEFNPSTPDSPVTSGTITDNGTQNAVIDDFRLYYWTETVAVADTTDVVFGNESGATSTRQPYLQCVQGTTGNTSIMESDYLPVRSGDYMRWYAEGEDDGDTVYYRPYIRFYDKDTNELTPLSSWVSGSMTTASGTVVTTGTGVSSAISRITDTAISGDAVFCKVGWRASTSQLANGLARRLFIRMSTKEPPLDASMNNLARSAVVRVVTGSPTKGFAPLGYKVTKSDGNEQYTCLLSLSTTSTSAKVATDTAVDATSVTGVAAGDIVGINQDDRTTHWTTVSSVAVNVVNLTNALTAGSASGSRIVFVRWRSDNSVSADKGDAAATLTVGTSENTSVWNTTLTAARAVTLSTTGALNGSRFRIIRTASATGDFKLNVGTGPLIALACGEWCDVEYNGSAWILAAHYPVGGKRSVSADKGNAAATLTVGVSEVTNLWNTAITADRAVTLNTGAARDGDRFRIIRGAGATGAFNLNVGTGPLKALATASTWCDVEFDGSAWLLSAYGSL